MTKYCEVKTELHAAKKLACVHAAEWCMLWKSWGMHDEAQQHCTKMKELHRYLAGAKLAGAKKEEATAPTDLNKETELVASSSKTAFDFDWGNLEIPSVPYPPPEPPLNTPVIKKLEHKLIPGMTKYCEVKTELHAAKKLACAHAGEFCMLFKSWGMHDEATEHCNTMEKLHKDLMKAVKECNHNGCVEKPKVKPTTVRRL